MVRALLIPKDVGQFVGPSRVFAGVLQADIASPSKSSSLSAAADSASALRACHVAANSASCSFDNCSLLRLRCASSSSRNRLWYLFCSASDRSSCSARSTTIFRSVSESRGKLFGSIATMCPDYAENGPIPSKNNRKSKRFMSSRTDTVCAASDELRGIEHAPNESKVGAAL